MAYVSAEPFQICDVATTLEFSGGRLSDCRRRRYHTFGRRRDAPSPKPQVFVSEGANPRAAFSAHKCHNCTLLDSIPRNPITNRLANPKPALYLFSMRFHFSSVLRTLYTLSNLTRSRASQPTPLLNSAPHRATLLRSMPIPLIGGLFSSKASDSSKMSYPVQKSDNEWRAVLNKGNAPMTSQSHLHSPHSHPQ